MRLPEYLLDDNIKKSLNYKFYDDAYNGIQEEATIQTRSKGSVISGSTTSTTGSPQTKSKATPKTKTSTKPKPTPKSKHVTKPKKKVIPKLALQDEPTPPPSESDSEFDTESEEEEEDFERRVKVPEETFPETEIAIQQSLATFEADSSKRKGITINEPNDDEDDEPIVEQLVDKRKLKSIIVDTRAEDKQFRKDQRDASLLSRLHPQPVNLSEHEGTTSSIVPPIESTTPEPSDRVEDKDAEGNITMTEAANTEERVDEQENIATDQGFDPFITP